MTIEITAEVLERLRTQERNPRADVCDLCGATGVHTGWRSWTGDLCDPCDEAYRNRPAHLVPPDIMDRATGSLGQPYFDERG